MWTRINKTKNKKEQERDTYPQHPYSARHRISVRQITVVSLGKEQFVQI